MDREEIIRLKNNPIIESVFEIRYKSAQPSVCEFIPGILFANLEGPKKTLPVLPIPLEIIKIDQNMQVVPTFSLEWNDVIIHGNPFFLAVSFKQPYKQWRDFKTGIEKIHKILFDNRLFEKITRYSMKYANFIDKSTIRCARVPALSLLNLDIRISSETLSDQKTTLRVELPGDDYLNIIDVISSDNLTIKEKPGCAGLLLITDTICIKEELLPDKFMENHGQRLDNIHEANKNKFFDILTDTALKILEPEYA